MLPLPSCSTIIMSGYPDFAFAQTHVPSSELPQPVRSTGSSMMQQSRAAMGEYFFAFICLSFRASVQRLYRREHVGYVGTVVLTIVIHLRYDDYSAIVHLSTANIVAAAF